MSSSEPAAQTPVHVHVSVQLHTQPGWIVPHQQHQMHITSLVNQVIELVQPAALPW